MCVRVGMIGVGSSRDSGSVPVSVCSSTRVGVAKRSAQTFESAG